MAGDWIKMRTNLDTDPAVVRLASGLKQDRYAIVGRLHKIWSWANEHLTDGQDVPIDSAFLDALVETPGFAEQLRRVGWLSGRENSLCFPNFDRHNGESAKTRALDAARKRAHRASAKCPGDNRTKRGPEREKRREEERRVDNTLSPACEESKKELPRETHLLNPQFQKLWDKWCLHQLELGKTVTNASSESQLYKLADFAVDEAMAIVEFSLQRGAKNLILNGDHKREHQASDRPRSAKRSRAPGAEAII